MSGRSEFVKSLQFRGEERYKAATGEEPKSECGGVCLDLDASGKVFQSGSAERARVFKKSVLNFQCYRLPR